MPFVFPLHSQHSQDSPWIWCDPDKDKALMNEWSVSLSNEWRTFIYKHSVVILVIVIVDPEPIPGIVLEVGILSGRDTWWKNVVLIIRFHRWCWRLQSRVSSRSFRVYVWYFQKEKKQTKISTKSCTESNSKSVPLESVLIPFSRRFYPRLLFKKFWDLLHLCGSAILSQGLPCSMVHATLKHELPPETFFISAGRALS